MSRRRPKSLDLGLKSVKPETERRMNSAPNRMSRIRLPTSNIEKVLPTTATVTTTTTTTATTTAAATAAITSTVATVSASSVGIQTKQNESTSFSVS